ncbi:MAG TPA: hypothetical protein VHI75_09700 [Casimicrobiaceae bacterium]|nr:hypothetical protein [Casimicrobiaceae bacterium]
MRPDAAAGQPISAGRKSDAGQILAQPILSATQARLRDPGHFDPAGNSDLAGRGKLGISIGRSVKLDEAIALIGELKAGRRTKGKAVIVMA